MTSPLAPEQRDSKQDGAGGEARERGPRDSGGSQLSPAFTRAIVEQLFLHRHQEGRRQALDLLGARYGWTRGVPGSLMPVEPEELDA